MNTDTRNPAHFIQYIADTMVEVERLYDVNSLTRQELLLWPFLRLSIILCAPTIKKWVKFGIDYNVYADWESRVHTQPCEHVLSLDATARPADVVLFSWPEDNNDILDGRRYNKHIDPFYEMCRAEGLRCLKLEPANPSDASLQPHAIQPAFLTLDAVDVPRWSGPAPFDQRIFDGLRQTLARHAPHVRIDYERVALLSYATCYLRDRFIPVLERLQPKVVILTRIYNCIAKALICACRRLGIATIDFLHSSTIPSDYKYGHWTKVPPKGYPTLPDAFWCWSEESASHLACFQSGPDAPHVPLVGGNPWVEKWRGGDISALGPGEQDFVRSLEGYDRTILFSLQLIDDCLPRTVREAIAASPPSWMWLLRLHPYQRGYLPEILAALEGLGGGARNIEQATALPLYALLPRCSHHVTCASSVAREATVFAVPTTVVHEFGRNIFAEELGRGEYGYAPDAGTLLGRIRDVVAAPAGGASGQGRLFRPNATLGELLPRVLQAARVKARRD